MFPRREGPAVAQLAEQPAWTLTALATAHCPSLRQDARELERAVSAAKGQTGGTGHGLHRKLRLVDARAYRGNTSLQNAACQKRALFR